MLSMTRKTSLSAASCRTEPPVISEFMQTALANPGLISLAAGFVDQQSLPHAEVARIASEILADPVQGRRALQYGTTIGDVGLRKELVALLERNERVAPGTFASILPRVVVTTGSAQLLYLVAEALLDPGDIVLVEAPTYFVFLGVLETRGARAIGIEIDEGGMRLDALESTLADLESRGELDRVKLIYTVSEHSNPSGISLAEERRGPLVDLARRWSKTNRIHILEDAAYRGLNYEGDEPSSVWRHDPEGETVILARTFSKTFSPGMKLGFGVLPADLIAPVVSLKGNHDFGTTNLTQQVLARALADGTYDRHLGGLIAMYREKRDAMLGALEEHFGGLDGAVTWTRPKGGMFIWLAVPEGVDLGSKGAVLARCLEQGVLYIPGSFAFPDEPGPVPTNYARVCFGVPSVAELTEGVGRLSAALAECLDPVA
jgi:2-aminoadipate transaminase